MATGYQLPSSLVGISNNFQLLWEYKYQAYNEDQSSSRKLAESLSAKAINPSGKTKLLKCANMFRETRIFICWLKWTRKLSFPIGLTALTRLTWRVVSNLPGGRKNALQKNASMVKEKPVDPGWSTSHKLDQRKWVNLISRMRSFYYFEELDRPLNIHWTQLSCSELLARLKPVIKMQNAASKKVGLIVLVRLDTAGMENHAKILTNVKKVLFELWNRPNYLLRNAYLRRKCYL